MNQSNQSLQVSKNNCFSEQNQPNQQHTDNPSQIAPHNADRTYDCKAAKYLAAVCEIFGGNKRPIFPFLQVARRPQKTVQRQSISVPDALKMAFCKVLIRRLSNSR